MTLGMMNMARLELKDISKSYNKTVKALNGFSFEFTNGIYGILGPNGAGKSTLMNIITRNISSDEGDIYLDGEAAKTLSNKYISRIGYMPQQQSVFDNLTLLRFMYYMASLKGVKKKDADEQIKLLLERVDLWQVRNRKLGGFSGGMKQRALIGQALLGNPDIVILDEPTAGLDPMQRVSVRNLIKDMAEDKIIMVSTHVVSDIEPIAKEILVMKQGEIIADRVMGDETDTEESLEQMYMRLFG